MTIYKNAIGGDHQEATFIIAASDSLHPERADYVCDGVDDDVQIQAAIDALPDIGGKICFTEGKFFINDTISVDIPVIWQGSGMGEDWVGAPSGYTGSLLAATASLDVSMIKILTGHFFGAFYDLGFSGLLQPQLVNPTDNAAIDLANNGDSIFSHVGFFDLPYRSPLHIKNHGTWVTACDFENCRACSCGAITVENSRNFITSCYFSGNKRSMDINTDRQLIHNCVFRSADDYHIWTQGSEKINISDCRFDSWNGDAGTRTAITFGSDSCKHYDIHDNVFDGSGCGTAGIWDADKTVDYIMIHHNNFHDFGAVVPIDMTFANANGMVRDNIGFVTESSGTATLISGTTSIAVTHSLNKTPAIGDVVVTPIEAWGSMTQFYIDTYTATQFTIHADQNPAQDVDFAWKAIVL